jgi:dTDP-glucose pyrophosphorylase/CBS domain-containing protein
MVDLAKLRMSPNHSIREVMACIDHTAKGIALITDKHHRLMGTVTDGDIRRAILAGMDLNLPVKVLLDQRSSTPYPIPITAPFGTPEAKLLHLMNKNSIRHIPLMDERGRVVDVALLSDLIKEYELPLSAVVMAGGYGTRLRPLTKELPKSMLPIGDKPLLELIIEQLSKSGIRRVHLTTHYKGEIIAQHFGDGRDFGVEISYVNEDQPLGTVGALSLLNAPDEPLLVMNGDILTRVDFRAMLDFHREYQADMTVAVRQCELRVPYGVVETDGVLIRGISEKPSLRHFINAGIYLLNPGVCRFIPNRQSYDMPDLITRLVADGHQVVSFPVREYWLDIGQVKDYHKALADAEKGEV